MGLDTVWRGSVARDRTTLVNFSEVESEEAAEIITKYIDATESQIIDQLRSMKMDDYKQFEHKDKEGVLVSLYATKYQL